MKKKTIAEVTAQNRIAAGIFDLRLSAPEIARTARAGQFADLYCRDQSRLLPRPVSLAGIDAGKGEIRLVYRISGAGTEEFSRLSKGDTLEVLGPLGNGFPVEEALGRPLLLIGGGIGIPPLLETAKAVRRTQRNVSDQNNAADRPVLIAVLGYRDAETFLAEEFAAVCDRVLIATEDGSVGTPGNVLDAVREAYPDGLAEIADCSDNAGRSDNAGLSENAGRSDNAGCSENAGAVTMPAIFACGPTPMFRALKDWAEKQKADCWISLEERMACGIGACLACVCKTKETDAHSQVKNRRICKDGPVFRAEEIVL